MPRLSRARRVAMGASPQQLSYDGNVISWDANPPLPVYSFANTPVLGRQIAWLNDWTLIFESSQSGAARLYTYDTRTGAAVQVSSTGADRLRASGDVWAAWLSASGYRDSNSRTHADYGVIGVDDDGTVLVVLNNTTQKGLGYLLPTAASASDVVVITNFTQVAVPDAIAFRIFQDMLGNQTLYRISLNGTTELVQDLAEDDDIIALAKKLNEFVSNG